MGCPAFRPTSTKHPHWVMLGFSTALAKPNAVERHHVLGRPLTSFANAAGELGVVNDACPHGGASLAKGAVKQRAIECPRHGLHVGPLSHPMQFYEYINMQGFVWLDVSNGMNASRFTLCDPMPPYFLNLSDVNVVSEFSMTVRENAAYVLEQMLGLGCLSAAARVDCKGPRGVLRSSCETPHGRAMSVTEYHVPFTVNTHMSLNDAALMVITSLLPMSPESCAVHVRVASRGPDALVDTLMRKLELCLHPPDEFVDAYKAAMQDIYPDLQDYFKSH